MPGPGQLSKHGSFHCHRGTINSPPPASFVNDKQRTRLLTSIIYNNGTAKKEVYMLAEEADEQLPLLQLVKPRTHYQHKYPKMTVEML